MNFVKPIELRIGNILYTQTLKEIYIVKKIEHNFIYTCYPIPIANDLLIKLGFKDNGIFVNKVQLPQSPSGTMDGSKEFTIRETRIFNESGKYYYEIGSHFDDYGEYNFTHHLSYIHQLQNFHYAFTGEELKLKQS